MLTDKSEVPKVESKWWKGNEMHKIILTVMT